jgi:hypothetical protein
LAQSGTRDLERGGFILFDDSADSSGWEVRRVAEEVKASGKYHVVIKNPKYLFVKRQAFAGPKDSRSVRE